jgi:hypothetical protein
MNSGQVVSWGTTTRTHLYPSPVVPGRASARGKSSARRTCISDQVLFRFAEIEQIAVLSIIVLHYKITVLDEPQYGHETVEERKRRVLAPHPRSPLHVKPIRTPVTFTPREGTNIFAY